MVHFGFLPSWHLKLNVILQSKFQKRGNDFLLGELVPGAQSNAAAESGVGAFQTFEREDWLARTILWRGRDCGCLLFVRTAGTLLFA